MLATSSQGVGSVCGLLAEDPNVILAGSLNIGPRNEMGHHD
ncbi:hypothetical protein TRICHSKD4_2036 [Roseibium sp. TrichSKD4]|nr:hypothetical protein TRICHSKD4_2036 [Roseibium sp. TrichSKD4]